VGVSDDAEPHVARRLVDLGLVPGTEVTVVRRAPLRDPTLYRFADTSMCLRAAQARWVTVRLGVSAAVTVRPGVTVA
jgi:ferrous iron transport protein A